MSFVPNADMTDCVMIQSKDYIPSKEQCIKNCTSLNFTPIHCNHEKFCTKQNCIESCDSVKNKNACLRFCNGQENFFKKNDYNYLFCCGSDPKSCALKCKKAIECRFNRTSPDVCQQIHICKDSCSFDKNRPCNQTNDFCWMYDANKKKWRYNFMEKCGKIDNNLFLQEKTADGRFKCSNHSGLCRWECSGSDRPRKISTDPKLRCYERKNNCCRDDVVCLSR